jgi:hypothetical protein
LQHQRKSRPTGNYGLPGAVRDWIAAKYSPAKVYETCWGLLGVAHCAYFSCLCLHALLDILPLSGTVKSGIRKAATVHVELKETLDFHQRHVSHSSHSLVTPVGRVNLLIQLK